jgi:hypothetical protein
MSKLLPKTNSLIQERMQFVRSVTDNPEGLKNVGYKIYDWIYAEQNLTELQRILERLPDEIESKNMAFIEESKTKLNSYVQRYLDFQNKERLSWEQMEKAFKEPTYTEILEKYNQTIREANDCLLEMFMFFRVIFPPIYN